MHNVIGKLRRAAIFVKFDPEIEGFSSVISPVNRLRSQLRSKKFKDGLMRSYAAGYRRSEQQQERSNEGGIVSVQAALCGDDTGFKFSLC